VTYPMRASYKNSIQRRLGVLGLGRFLLAPCLTHFFFVASLGLSFSNQIARTAARVVPFSDKTSHLALSMNGRMSRVGIETATRSHEPPSYDASCAHETRVYARVRAPAPAFARSRVRVNRVTTVVYSSTRLFEQPISAVSGHDGSPVNTRASTSSGLMVTEHSATATAATNTRQLVPHRSTGTAVGQTGSTCNTRIPDTVRIPDSRAAVPTRRQQQYRARTEMACRGETRRAASVYKRFL
ncbi:hypothetical protein ALC62_04801, partial [Cyphomyrmex costatus]